MKSLTVENIAYEIFSHFTAAFEDIRKVRLLIWFDNIQLSSHQAQVNFFLANWTDIRTSSSMRNVWQQIRNGRHPGFEEG